MKKLLRTIDRRNKTPIKYKFRFEPKQLTIETDENFCPDQIQFLCIHRNRCFSSKPRKLESSCTIASRRLVVWPDSLADAIELETTLYNNKSNDTPDDKNWTLLLEGTITKVKNGKLVRRALASAELNMKSFIGKPGEKAEMRLSLRPLENAVKFCQVEIDIFATPITATDSESEQIAIYPKKITNTPTQLCRQELQVSVPQIPHMVTNESSMMQLQQTVINDEQYQPSTIQSAASTQFKANRKSSTSDSLVKPNFIMKKSQDTSDGSEIGISNKLANIIQNDRSETQQPISYSSRVSGINQVEEIEQFDHSAPRSHLVTTTTREIFPKSAPPQLFTARPKPMPPNQAEVQALISNLIAKKRPDLGGSTPRTSRAMADTASQNGTNNRAQSSSSTTGQLPRQSSVSNSLLEKARKIQAEFQQIDQQIEEIEQQDQFVLTKITDFAKDTEQERELIEHHQRLVGEKDQLSRRQDYLNVQLELNETEFKIAHLRSRLSNNSTEEEAHDSSILMQGHRRDSNDLLLELKKLVDQKNELTHQLSDMELEDEEGMERNRLILEKTRTQNFSRGQDEPLNVSKRLINWLGVIEQRLK